jgi:hypothetical protein
MPPKKQAPVLPKEDSIPEIKKKPVLKKGKTEAKSEPKPEAKPEAKSESKPEPKPEPKPEVAKVIKKKGKEIIPKSIEEPIIEEKEVVPEVVKEIKVIKKKGKSEPVPKPEPKEKPVPEVVKKGKTIKSVDDSKIDLSKIEADYNVTFKEWESVNQSLSTLKKEITNLEEKRHNILTQLNKLLKKMQGDDNENITNHLEAPSTLKKEITKVVISPKASSSDDDENDDDDDDEDSESIKKGIQKFNQADSDNDTDDSD